MDAATDANRPLRFGSFELDVRSRELRNGSTRIRLQEQPFAILRMMLERPGGVVTRDELQQRLWPSGTYVDFEHSINAAVTRLRIALGDNADHPRFVETLPRRGYRFIGAAVESATRTSTGPKVRLAVLPFVNLSSGDRDPYFADGLTGEMIAQLGQLCRGRIAVISRYSSMVFKDTGRRAREIGEALRADYLLEGSARCEGDRVRITARLIESASETHLWVETYEPDLTDWLSVQKEVAARIARSLALELMPDGPHHVKPVSSNSSAYQAYLKGRCCWNMLADQGVQPAIAHFAEATELDPSFALAHVGMARAQVLRAEYYRSVPRHALECARQSVEHALHLEPHLFEAHLALGEIRRMLEWDWRGAESAYAEAIRLNPSHEGAHRAYGLLLAGQLRSDEAIRESERACDMDPLCVVVSSSGAAWVRYLVGDYETAIARSREAVEIEPQYFAAHRVLAASYLCTGRARDAIAVLESAVTTAGDDPVLLAWLAHAKGATGHRDQAVEVVHRLSCLATRRHVPGYHLALALVGISDVDAAFAALEQATADRDPALFNLRAEPRFEPIRDDVRYTRLIGRLGL